MYFFFQNWNNVWAYCPGEATTKIWKKKNDLWNKFRDNWDTDGRRADDGQISISWGQAELKTLFK